MREQPIAKSCSRSSSPVLLADGCAFGRRQARRILAELGFDWIHEAADGVEAVGILSSVTPALLVLDWDLRVIRTADVLDIARGAAGEGSLPVLMTMTEPTKTAVHAAVELGVKDIVAKPYSARIMRPRLAKLIRP